MEPNANLLGRRPSTPDVRDFTVEMVKTASPVELAFQRLMVARGANVAVKNWAAEVMDILSPIITPPPPPEPPALESHIWALPDRVLDQDDTPHCGGFGGCQWSNLEPGVSHHFADLDGHALYYESVAAGGYPGTEDGVESRWVAQALQARRCLDTYAFATSIQEVRDWVRTKGPVMMGTDWTEAMFDPAADGTIKVDGDIMGGHFWVVCGDLPDEAKMLCVNSWGESWGAAGFFRLSYAHLDLLLNGIAYPGDAIVSPELAH